jgi:hypothetical protein
MRRRRLLLLMRERQGAVGWMEASGPDQTRGDAERQNTTMTVSRLMKSAPRRARDRLVRTGPVLDVPSLTVSFLADRSLRLHLRDRRVLLRHGEEWRGRQRVGTIKQACDSPA